MRSISAILEGRCGGSKKNMRLALLARHKHTVASMQDTRTELMNLLVRNSFKMGQFTLSSGATSDYYVDCRATTLHADGARLTGRILLDLIRNRGWQPQAVGGMTLGADPMVVAVSVLSSQEAQPRRGYPAASPHAPINGFLVRKAEKGHGMQRRIEGFSQRGAKVVIVDDVCTTGGSTIQAIEAAREAEMEVIGAICLVEREASGRANVEAAAAPAAFVSVFRIEDLRDQYRTLYP